MRFLPAGTDAVLVELDGLDPVLALLRWLRRHLPPGVTEMIPAARTLLLRFDPHLTSAPQLAALIARICDAGLDQPAETGDGGRDVCIPVHYDGVDLAEVAALTGLAPAEVAARHSATPWLAAFNGFAPGFCYLTGGDPVLNVPRRTSPRTAIPAGSVALAGMFSGVYPQQSPGGWQIIGTTTAAMWDTCRTPPALIAPGDRVRFIDAERIDGAAAMQPAGATARRSRPGGAVAQHRAGSFGAPAFTVLAAPVPALVQDRGRVGLAAQGIARSGAADQDALAAVNAALGNCPDAPALELVGAGFRLRAETSTEIAVTGAAGGLILDGAWRFDAGSAVPVNPGDEVTVIAAPGGIYGYLGLRGGFAVERVLGSAATDTLAGIGPSAVTAGAALYRGADIAGAVAVPGVTLPAQPRAGDVVALAVTLGPRADWFTDEAVASFLAQAWRVTEDHSRVGKRLAGTALARSPGPDGAGHPPVELPSEGVVRGAVQVPHSGQPLLFLADHPLTGGYPVIAVVDPADLGRAAQAPPGAWLRFKANGPFAPVPACRSQSLTPTEGEP